MADVATPPVEDKKAKVVFEKPEKPDEDAFRTAEKKAQKEHDDAQAKYVSSSEALCHTYLRWPARYEQLK